MARVHHDYYMKMPLRQDARPPARIEQPSRASCPTEPCACASVATNN